MLLTCAGLSFSDCGFGLGRSTLRWGVRGRGEQLFSIPDFYSQGWTRINYQLFVCRSKIGRKCRVAFVIEPSDSLHYNFLWIGGVRGRSEQLFSIPEFYLPGNNTSLGHSQITVRSQSDHSPIYSPITVRSYVSPATPDFHRKKDFLFQIFNFFFEWLNRDAIKTYDRTVIGL